MVGVSVTLAGAPVLHFEGAEGTPDLQEGVFEQVEGAEGTPDLQEGVFDVQIEGAEGTPD